jgi:membrane protease YdiL (CAAX protease family)
MGAGIIGVWALIHGTGIGHQSVMSELAATGIAQVFVMLFGTYFLIKLFRQHPITTLRLEGFAETPVAAYLLAIPTIFAAQFVGSMLAVLWEHVLQYFPTIYHNIKEYEDLIDEATKGAAISANTLPHALIVLLTIAIIPPLAEEVVFRGFAQTNIERSGKNKPRPYVAIIWASLAFAAMHLQPIELPGLLVLGLTLGWLSYRTNNLLVGSVAHAANNGIIVLTLMMMPQVEKSDAASSILGNVPTSVPYALTVLALTLPLFAMCLYFYHAVTKPLHARYNSQLQYEVLEEDIEQEYEHLDVNDQ